ncbi:hypothetical protein TIFTF001_038666 [Ficus carica]|uniref:Uncharacterized protein n=1 Tax=Ficus carica TaxID=3494 RepID=A0AA88E8G6_FICCA|nr:hypothetical protein TIFTF001_038661 [Ficus carica]GMN69617.1 hypothetical protein TIFTF001_038666 [Ficus carica]
MFSIGRAKKPTGSRASHSPVDRWSPAPEILHHQQIRSLKKEGSQWRWVTKGIESRGSDESQWIWVAKGLCCVM